MAKFGLLLIVVACGVLAFLAGVLAPVAVGQPVQQAMQKLLHSLPFAKPAAAAASAATASGGAASAPAAAASAPAAAASGAAAAASSPASAASVPYASLLLPTMPATTATYALQAGQFAARESAEALAASINGRGVTSTVVLTVDERGTSWAVVGIGRFTSPEEALAQQAYLANQLGLPKYAMPIVLPPPPPPKPAAP